MHEPLGDGPFVQRWISAGDVIVLVSSLLAIGVMWGSLSKDVSTIREDVRELKLRDITPGAKAEIGSIHSTDLALQRQIDEIREELRASRREMVESLIEVPIVGRIYTGRVVRPTDFGAFVEIMPSTDGMVHISQLDSERVYKVEDIARVGDELTVMVTDIDANGKIRLSRQAVLEGWTAEEAQS